MGDMYANSLELGTCPRISSWSCPRFKLSIVFLILNPGNHDEGETPVPIPNTEAKPLGADGTARGAEWESRMLPGFLFL